MNFDRNSDISDPEEEEVVECRRSFWTYTDRGGILNVKPKLTDIVEKGAVVAVLRNVWGEQIRTYKAPERGIVIGKTTNPAARAGSRIIHLGVIGRNGDAETAPST